MTRENPIIEPIPSEPDNVDIFELRGIVNILTRHICDTIGRRLKNFQANNVALEEIGEDTFFNCKKMSELHLKNNKIIKLHENAFRGTYQLKEIWFDQGIVPIENLHLRDSISSNVVVLRKFLHFVIRK